jgi:hypothetical protein
MPVDRATFDADQLAEATALTAYITAVNAFIDLQQVLDLAAEDAVVQAGLTAIAEAQAHIPPPPKPGA